MIEEASTGWGLGIPYVGWIVIDLRDGNVAVIAAVVGEHNPACSVDHGDTRHVFAHREFIDDKAYDRLFDLGYRDYPLVDFVRYPAAEGVLKILGLIGRQRCQRRQSTRDRWAGLICLRHERLFVDIDALIEAENKAFGRDALKIPEVIGTATGPIPRPNDSMPNAE